MPRRRHYKKKRRAPTNPRPLQITKARVPRRNLPRIINFKRQMVNTFQLNTAAATAPWVSLAASNDEALVLNYVIDAAQIPNIAHFVNLFDSYRIKGVRIQGYLSFTTAQTTTQSQSILYSCSDNMGQTPSANLTEDYFLSRPRSKKRLLANNMGKPSFDQYIPLSNLANVYGGTINTDYALVKPRFISTNELTTPYYGMNLRLQRVDNQNWTHGAQTQYPTLKMYTTIYFQMRGIKS
eukprot:SAG31_NODE_7058_length_1800_cov_122.113463_2_plen_238_part_00